jgi:hypothetical protein
MGGMGSGRRNRYDAANCTDDYRRLDVRRWQRDGFLKPGQTFGWQWTGQGEIVASIQVRAEADRVILLYRHRSGVGDWKSEEYPVLLNWTGCTYGGQRAWFLCPAQGCGRRVALLYGGVIFACRHCHQLSYRSQRETSDDRAARRADKIKERLGWKPGIFNGAGAKPKGMRRDTYLRLLAQHNVYVHEALTGMAQRFGIKIGD